MTGGSLWRELIQWLWVGTSSVSLLSNIALLLTVTRIVRRHRPDAYQRLQIWAIASLVVFVAMWAAWRLSPRLDVTTTPEGVDAFFKWQVLLTVLGSGLQIGLLVLHVRGLVALAQPPKPITVEGAPPYR